MAALKNEDDGKIAILDEARNEHPGNTINGDEDNEVKTEEKETNNGQYLIQSEYEFFLQEYTAMYIIFLFLDRNLLLCVNHILREKKGLC